MSDIFRNFYNPHIRLYSEKTTRHLYDAKTPQVHKEHSENFENCNL